MCASVPHKPTAVTRTSTSYGEITGRGMSRTSSRRTSHKTVAFIVWPDVNGRLCWLTTDEELINHWCRGGSHHAGPRTASSFRARRLRVELKADALSLA